MRRTNTREHLLDAAQELVQTRGYNAFSYRDLALQIGIRTASIHHHFPAKDDLCRVLMARYRERFAEELAQILARPRLDPLKQLRAYIKLFRNTLESGDRLCLCGMLASDLYGLSEDAVEEVRGFVIDNQDWLGQLLTNGRKTASMEFQGTAEAEASFLFASLEGALLVSRTQGGIKHFDTITKQIYTRYRVSEEATSKASR